MTSSANYHKPKPVSGNTSSLPTIETPTEANIVLDDSDLALLEKMKSEFGSQLDELYPLVLQTFITGYKHCGDIRENETRERLAHYLKRFKDYNFSGCLDEELVNEEKMMNAWRVYIYGLCTHTGWDKQGHPILYDEIGCADITAVTDAFSNDIEIVRKYRFRFHRRLANCKRIQADRYEVPIFKHVMVMDMSGFCSSHFNAQYRAIVKDIIGDEQNIFPETLKKLYVVNAPWPFRLIWNVICTFIDPLTAQKISVAKNTSELLREIDVNQIPPKYGGKGKWEIILGKCASLPHDRYPLEWKENKGVNVESNAKLNIKSLTTDSTPMNSSSNTNNNGSIAG